MKSTVIGISTMCAYLMGLKGDPLTASTMAFATICLARLLHGFNCQSSTFIKNWFIFKQVKHLCILNWFCFVTLYFICSSITQYLHGTTNFNNSIIMYLWICFYSYNDYSNQKIIKQVRQLRLSFSFKNHF